MSDNWKSLLSILTHIPQENYPCQSRVHDLSSFDTVTSRCFVKRDDELGFGISGSKIRKYRSLITFFRTQAIEEVIIIGSAYSNHVVSILQLLIENRIYPTLFLRGDPEQKVQGNYLLTQLFVNPSHIHWLSRMEWPSVEKIARKYAEKQSKKTFVLVEGGSAPEALPGMLTLPLDIKRNEEELGIEFDHFFIEAGTGMMASSVILGWNWLEKKTSIHVLLLVGDETSFLEQLQFLHREFEKLMGRKCDFPQNFVLHKPKQLASFGSSNAQLFKEIKQLAQSEGFLTDPIYTAKLFVEAKQIIKEGYLSGNILLNHSGGTLTLMGFQKQLMA